jgi:hypothetical protein
MSDPVTVDPHAARARLLSDPVSDAGRLWVLSVMGLVAGAIPLPAIPTALLRRVRGAVVHEVSARYGLGLTADARESMSEPSKTVSRGAFVATAAYIAKRALRRLGVLGVLPPIVAWLEVYSLGLMFERYLSTCRRSQTVRIDLDEARIIRTAIDQATGHVLSLELRAERANRSGAIEELRNLPTRVSDAVLIGVASGPSYLRRRLETAFDHAMRESTAASDRERGSGHV